MTWFKIDDAWWRSRKVRKLGRRKVLVSVQVAGAGVWALAGDWAADNLTDGFVPWEVVEDWDPRREIAARLIEVGFWLEVDYDGEAGVQFHDWNDWQPTKDQVTQRRKADAERRARWREGRRNGKTPASTTASTSTDEPEVSRRDTTRDETRESHGGSRPGSALPDPTRPDPTRKKKKNTLTDAAASAAFEEFWAHYPRKADKRTAERAYKQALGRGVAPDRIITAVKTYAATCHGTEPRFIKHASTWLNAGAYDNGPETALRMAAGSAIRHDPLTGVISER